MVFGFFSVVSSGHLPAHKPSPSFPQVLAPVMLRIYRGSTLWKTWGCLCTAKSPSISSAHTGHAFRVSRVFTATTSKKHVRQRGAHTGHASRVSRVLALVTSLENHPDNPPDSPDQPRAAFLRNAARGISVAPSEARPTHHKMPHAPPAWVKVGCT